MTSIQRIVALLVVASCASGAQGAVRRMFVTSASGTGDLGSWPDAGSATGLAAGDAICQARAAAAGLPNAGNYVAWLSDATDDAFCRLHGLGGKRSANCGQPSPPPPAGPWRRVGGTPFGPDTSRLFDPGYEAILPPRLDENGAAVHGDVWTGSNSSGADLFDCSGWTSETGGVLGSTGQTDATGSSWIWIGSYDCSTATFHLLCFDPGAGDPLPPLANWGRLAFVTSASGTGDLSSWALAGGQVGLAAGDAICANLAGAAGLPSPESFKAWLSTATVDARDRFDHDGPWIRVDRARLGTGLADLTDGYLNTALNVDEHGDFVLSSAVWTGTVSGGTADTDRCGDWTSSSAAQNGDGGLTDDAEPHWTSFVQRSCDAATNRLYCLQDLPLVFWDGFESGTTGAWSVAVP